jgi:glutamate synthase (NADPH/NADH) large chain
MARRGLYHPSQEHDACGLGFVVDIAGRRSHGVVEDALTILRRMEHRGAVGADPETSDGAGILLAMPHSFLEYVMEKQGDEIPTAGDYGVAQLFVSRDPGRRDAQMNILREIVRYHGQKIIAFREVPVNLAAIGPSGRASMPMVLQLFVARFAPRETFEHVLYLLRKRVENRVRAAGLSEDFYIASFSSQTIVYKGLMLPSQLGAFYPDLRHRDLQAHLALVHSRFSTNTNPTWERAHPYRRLCHNGEINTLRGNRNAMRAREALLAASRFGEHLQDFKPILDEAGSDSSNLDELVDFLLASGRPLPHVLRMLVPEAWETNAELTPEMRAFYQFHAHLVEPWDGPMALAVTDGESVAATVDRSGLRPAKYLVTKQGRVVFASEFGVLDIAPEDVAEKGQLRPGELLLIDTKARRIVPQREVDESLANARPWASWLREYERSLPATAPIREAGAGAAFSATAPAEAAAVEALLGWTREDELVLLAPMAKTGEEPIGSMGNDVALAILSPNPQPLFRFFKQQFAQVTNPPLDPLREALVLSTRVLLGAQGNLLAEEAGAAARLVLESPFLSASDLAALERREAGLTVHRIPLEFSAVRSDGGNGNLDQALTMVTDAAAAAVAKGASVLVLSDRGLLDHAASHVAIPTLLATGAVHHALIRAGLRAKVSLIVEAGDAKEVSDFALLFGYGASAIVPWLAHATLARLCADGTLGIPVEKALTNYRKASEKGLRKILSKMGISTLASYTGAQIFEAIGLGPDVIARAFDGTASPLGGLEIPDIAYDLERRRRLFAASAPLAGGGIYAWRRDGEPHLWSPETLANLQKSVRLPVANGSAQSPAPEAAYAAFAHAIDHPQRPVTLRGLWRVVPTQSQGPIPLASVEAAAEIVKRFCTGAMSFGSISQEAHEALAVAMNRIGGRSNTGEGGEDPRRFVPLANGDSLRSAIKQVASGRFGVTASYLVNADELQIKVAQGAKPGEGGQLPGHKVDAVIAKVRHATEGVGLVSPPPHHDIYSIEDLAQLIYDLRSINPRAVISVKLVSESGVGTIAAGAAKAGADQILIAGHDGGTGASPLSSIQHAGTPWELGLAETHEVLLQNELRDRVTVQADGQMRTGRDVVIAALLGANEFGFATAPLVALGCVMMRKCHLNTCPVGIATQDPVLRARFTGTPEQVIRYLFSVAEHVREILASLGYARLSDIVGRRELLRRREDTFEGRGHLLDFTPIFSVGAPHGEPLAPPARAWASDLERSLVPAVRAALLPGSPTVDLPVRLENHHRSFGAHLSGIVASSGLSRSGEPVKIHATGTAGQSFGAFLEAGLTITLVGDGNDYVGKGLSGGVLALRPPFQATFDAASAVIAGNTCLYGATSGRAFFRGRAGARFAVRNSGAFAVVEGVADHGCEYMTGGAVVILGTVGRNFAAGMSGGTAYILKHDTFEGRLNRESIVTTEVDHAEDRAELHRLLSEHWARTGSARAKELLDEGDAFYGRFVRVVGRDFAALLEKRRAAVARPPARAEGAAIEVNHG